MPFRSVVPRFPYRDELGSINSNRGAGNITLLVKNICSVAHEVSSPTNKRGKWTPQCGLAVHKLPVNEQQMIQPCSWQPDSSRKHQFTTSNLAPLSCHTPAPPLWLYIFSNFFVSPLLLNLVSVLAIDSTTYRLPHIHLPLSIVPILSLSQNSRDGYRTFKQYRWAKE